MGEADTPTLSLPPLNDAEWPGEIADLRDGFAGRLNIYRVMAHHPALLRSWAPFRDHAVMHSALSPQQRELVVLRVGFRWRAGYEWAHHVSRAKAAGLTDAQIKSAEGGSDPSLPEHCFFAAVDALIDEGRLKSASVRDLDARIGPEGILDLMAIVGMYSILAFIAKTFEVPVEGDLTHLAPAW